MTKLHTRQKRRILASMGGGRKRKPRPRTFASVEAAKKYAEANKLKDYKLVNMKSGDSNTKKIRIATS